MVQLHTAVKSELLQKKRFTVFFIRVLPTHTVTKNEEPAVIKKRLDSSVLTFSLVLRPDGRCVCGDRGEEDDGGGGGDREGEGTAMAAQGKHAWKICTIEQF